MKSAVGLVPSAALLAMHVLAITTTDCRGDEGPTLRPPAIVGAGAAEVTPQLLLPPVSPDPAPSPSGRRRWSIFSRRTPAPGPNQSQGAARRADTASAAREQSDEEPAASRGRFRILNRDENRAAVNAAPSPRDAANAEDDAREDPPPNMPKLIERGSKLGETAPPKGLRALGGTLRERRTRPPTVPVPKPAPER